MTPADQIISEVLLEHKIAREDLYWRCRASHLVAARKEVARRLKAIGYSYEQIARKMKRSKDTVRFYLNEHTSDYKKRRYAANGPLEWLDPDARQIVRDYAKAEGASPRIIIAQWVAERARYEAEQKARAA